MPDYTKDMFTAHSDMYICVGCDSNIKKGQSLICCPDCGAFFCEECVMDGTFANHDCM